MPITGKVKTWLNVRGVRKAVREATIPPLEKAAAIVAVTAQESMFGRGTSTVSRLKAPPSPPGTPPAVKLATLKGSIKFALSGAFTVLVGPGSVAFYGHFHEFGSAGGKIPPRPFMLPALRVSVKSFPGLFRNIKIRRTPTGRIVHNSGGLRP